MTLSKIVNVVDIKTTCWEPDIIRTPDMVEEIICFAIAAVDTESFEILECNTAIVKPLVVSNVSTHCTIKTGITLQEVRWSDSLIHTFSNIKHFKLKDRVLVTWSDSDRNIIINDCKRNNITYPFNDVHFNLRYFFSLMQNLNNLLDVSDAINILKIPKSNILGYESKCNDVLDKSNILLSTLRKYRK